MSSGKGKRFGSDKFKASAGSNLDRKTNTRHERNTKENLPKIVFSFKDIDLLQNAGQTYKDWQKEELLAYMLEKFGYINGLNIIEAQQQGLLTLYGDFPLKSDFKIPPHISGNVTWAAIKNIKGQKARIAGHIIENVFYVVFLDKNHKFFITEKKNT